MKAISKAENKEFEIDAYFTSWNDAIEEVFFHNEYLNNQLIRALPEFFATDDLVAILNIEEAEKGIRFFKTIFSYKLILKEIGLEQKLFRLCMVFAKFGEEDVLKLQNINKEMPGQIGVLELTLIFEKLFTYYESNRFLTLNFQLFNLEQTKDLLGVLKGASPKVFFKGDFALSEKEISTTYLLHDIPFCLSRFRHTEELVSRLLEYMKLLSLNPHADELLEDFFRYHTIWENDYDKYRSEFEYWKSCYLFFLENRMSSDFIGVSQYLDFVFFRKENALGEFRLFGRSLLNLNQLVYAFNEMQYQEFLEEQIKIREANWEADLTLINEVQFDNKTLFFKELICSRDLIKEGELMENCLLNFIEDCYHGWSRIFSVREGEVVLFNIELQKKKVVQALSKKNEELTEDLKEILSIWVEMNKLEIKK